MKFETGKYYVYKGKCRLSGWNDEGKMDFVLDNKPHLCTSVGVSIHYIGFDGQEGWNWTWGIENWEEVSGKDAKRVIKPEDLTRFMVYGTGCNDKSDLFKTEEELKANIKSCVEDSCWTGRIIGYKLMPLFEGESRVVVKQLGNKTTKKRGRPKKE